MKDIEYLETQNAQSEFVAQELAAQENANNRCNASRYKTIAETAGRLQEGEEPLFLSPCAKKSRRAFEVFALCFRSFLSRVASARTALFSWLETRVSRFLSCAAGEVVTRIKLRNWHSVEDYPVLVCEPNWPYGNMTDHTFCSLGDASTQNAGAQFSTTQQSTTLQRVPPLRGEQPRNNLLCHEEPQAKYGACGRASGGGSGNRGRLSGAEAYVAWNKTTPFLVLCSAAAVREFYSKAKNDAFSRFSDAQMGPVVDRLMGRCLGVLWGKEHKNALSSFACHFGHQSVRSRNQLVCLAVDEWFRGALVRTTSENERNRVSHSAKETARLHGPHEENPSRNTGQQKPEPVSAAQPNEPTGDTGVRFRPHCEPARFAEETAVDRSPSCDATQSAGNAIKPGAGAECSYKLDVNSLRSVPLRLVGDYLFETLSEKRWSQLQCFAETFETILKFSFEQQASWLGSFLVNAAQRKLELDAVVFQRNWAAWVEEVLADNPQCVAAQIQRSLTSAAFDTHVFLHTLNEMLFTNVEITFAAAGWLLYNLAANPAWQTRLRDELCNADARRNSLYGLSNAGTTGDAPGSPGEAYPDDGCVAVEGNCLTNERRLCKTMVCPVQGRRKDARTAEGESGGSALDAESLLACAPLTAFIWESFRTAPSVVLTLPEVLRAGTDLCGCSVPAGIGVSVDVHLLNRDPAVWGHAADQFRPERFLHGPLSTEMDKAWSTSSPTRSAGAAEQVNPRFCSVAQHQKDRETLCTSTGVLLSEDSACFVGRLAGTASKTRGASSVQTNTRHEEAPRAVCAPYTFQRFGLGARQCLGARLADLLLRHVVRVVLENGELSPPHCVPKTEDAGLPYFTSQTDFAPFPMKLLSSAAPQ